MSLDLICHRSWKQRLREWGTILFLCILGAVAAMGVQVLIDSVWVVKYTQYEPADVPPQTVLPRHKRERGEYERQDRVVLEK